MKYITLLSSLSIAGVAAWYSIAGLMAIFSGSPIPIAIMGGVLEVGKLVTASWLHNRWSEINWWMKTYLTSAVFTLMVITSLGIFGFLSKAHLEHSVATAGNQEVATESIERRIGRQQRIIDDAEKVLGQLDAQVQTLIDYDRIRGKDGAMNVRKEQKEERAELNAQIDEATEEVLKLNGQLDFAKRKQLEIEVEVGPLKYIAELIYGEEEAASNFDRAVRFVIILLIVVFDPLAIVLLLAANHEWRRQAKDKMFYEDGNLRVDPANVVDVNDHLSSFQEQTVEVTPVTIVEPEEEWEEWIEDEIPHDEDVNDYQVVAAEDEPELEQLTEEQRRQYMGAYDLKPELKT